MEPSLAVIQALGASGTCATVPFVSRSNKMLMPLFEYNPVLASLVQSENRRSNNNMVRHYLVHERTQSCFGNMTDGKVEQKQETFLWCAFTALIKAASEMELNRYIAPDLTKWHMQNYSEQCFHMRFSSIVTQPLILTATATFLRGCLSHTSLLLQP